MLCTVICILTVTVTSYSLGNIFRRGLYYILSMEYINQRYQNNDQFVSQDRAFTRWIRQLLPAAKSVDTLPLHPAIGFLAVDQPRPAGLVQTLLLIAGIEPNPGPIWNCTVCSMRIHGGSKCVSCNRCGSWIHLHRNVNCSGLASMKDWNDQYVCLNASACRQHLD